MMKIEIIFLFNPKDYKSFGFFVYIKPYILLEKIHNPSVIVRYHTFPPKADQPEAEKKFQKINH